MGNWTIKRKLTGCTGMFMTALLLAQPLLDVLSYFIQRAGTTAVTSVLRLVLLAVVSVYGFAITDRKQVYGAVYAVAGGFWLLHMLNCLRQGYADPLGDAAEYLKLVQFPLWTLSFVTFFRKQEGLSYHTAGILTVNVAVILLVIGLSFAVGQPGYTYDYPDRGIQIGLLGWFGVPNVQSAIVAILVPALLLWAWRREKLWVFCIACGVGFGLLYATGTRLTYYAALLIAGAFLVLILISRRYYLFCLPLLGAVALLLVFRGVSPMEERQRLTADSYAIYQEKTDAILGEGWDFTYRKGQEIPPEKLEKIRRVYVEVYGEEGVFGNLLLGGLLERFGVEQVMEQYQYATAPQVLYNVRTKRLMALELVWGEKDFLTRLLGFEYAECDIGGFIYDAENDLSALPFFYGYLGTALYAAFAAFFLLAVLRGLLENLRDIGEFLTVELGAYGVMYALALGAAQFSGQFLRKPSATVYLALAAAQLFCHAYPGREASLFAKYRHKPAVTIKHL